jgi:4-amino-4-deoxy-L-arabinose transferase-like glycosyltransferase
MNSSLAVSNPSDSPRNDRVFWLILGIAALLGLAYNAAILLNFGPDEPRHLAYVRLLVDERRLPFQLPGGGEYAGAHSYHPPLYYGILAPFYAILGFLGESGRYHALRLVSLALCLGALPMIYQIAARAANGNLMVARFTTAGVALLPIFGMTGGILNNDSALLFFVTLFLWALVVRFQTIKA